MGAVFLCRFEPIQLRRSRAKTRILSIILCFFANAELTGSAWRANARVRLKKWQRNMLIFFRRTAGSVQFDFK